MTIPKVFFASRSHPRYLALLRDVANRQKSHHLVSITGGLVFLHALSDRTSSLTLIDRTPEVHTYARAILELIRLSDSMSTFFGSLSGHVLRGGSAESYIFSMDRFDRRKAIFNQLSETSYQEIERWYGRGTFSLGAAQMNFPGDSVSFLLRDFRYEICNWLIGYGCFSSELEYTKMRIALIRLNPTIAVGTLEEYPFALCKETTYVLASNTDSPLFTQNDAVLRAIQRSANPFAHYLSRTRDFSVHWQPITSLPRYPSHLTFFAINGNDDDCRYCSEQFGGKWNPIDWKTYSGTLWYDLASIVFMLKDTQQAKALLQIFRYCIPIHQHLILISTTNESLEEFGSILSGSYSTSHFTQHATHRVFFAQLLHGTMHLDSSL